MYVSIHILQQTFPQLLHFIFFLVFSLYVLAQIKHKSIFLKQKPLITIYQY